MKGIQELVEKFCLLVIGCHIVAIEGKDLIETLD